MKSLIGLIVIFSYSRAFSPSPHAAIGLPSRVLISSKLPVDSIHDGFANSESNENYSGIQSPNRRSFLVKVSQVALVVSGVQPANAGIDPSSLKSLPVEGDTSGAATRLRQIESADGPRPEDSKDIAFEVLPSGASFREYREGKGDATIQPGSKVAVEMTIRCRSFATANEPGGLKYFSTKEDTEFNELAWTIGDGQLPPELEEGMMGMRKGAVRRIELPSTTVFNARKLGTLPLPNDKNKDGKRRFDNLFKTDATLMFEVLVTRIK
jgi:FKBP-type peptidyl-prolyl cis-trans isomerase